MEIDNSLAEGFDTKISELDSRLTEERAALAIEEDRESAAVRRLRITKIEQLRATIVASKSAIADADNSIGQDEMKFVRWRGLCAVAREKRDVMQKLDRSLPAARDRAVLAENAAAKVERGVAQAREVYVDLAKPEAYSTEPELAAAKAQLDAWQKKYAAAHSKFIALVRLRDEIQRDWFLACRAYDDASFHERMARLPATEPAAPAFASKLAAVR
jgi:hypothetical protein